MRNFFDGAWPALVTPFSADATSIDLESYASLIEHVIAGGVRGVVVCGSTGEAATLQPEEYFALVEHALAVVGSRAEVIVGIGSNDTRTASALAERLSEYPLAAVMVVTPPYNKPSQAGLREHFRAVARSSKHPLVAYNVPGRTGVNLLPATVGELVQSNTIASLKDASGSIDQLLDTVQQVGDRLPILSGEDSLVVPAIACGARGVISVAANVVPAEYSRMVAAALEGDFPTARRIQLEQLPLVRALFCETNPVPVKAALALQGVIAHATPRLPLLAAAPNTLERLRTCLAR